MKKNDPKDIDYDRMYSHAHGLHFVNLHDAKYDEDFDEVDDFDDEELDDIDDEDEDILPCHMEDWDKDCTGCPHFDEHHSHPVEISDEILDLIDAIEEKGQRMLDEDEDEDEYTPLRLFLEQGPEFISRVTGLVMLGEAAFENGGPVALPNEENGMIGFLGVTDEGKITNEYINSIAYITKSETGERGLVMMNGDGVGGTFTDVNETMKCLSEMFKQLDIFEEATLAVLRKWVAE